MKVLCSAAFFALIAIIWCPLVLILRANRPGATIAMRIQCPTLRPDTIRWTRAMMASCRISRWSLPMGRYRTREKRKRKRTRPGRWTLLVRFRQAVQAVLPYVRPVFDGIWSRVIKAHPGTRVPGWAFFMAIT